MSCVIESHANAHLILCTRLLRLVAYIFKKDNPTFDPVLIVPWS